MTAVERVGAYLTANVKSTGDYVPTEEDLDKARAVIDSYRALVDPMTGRFTHVE